MSKFAKEKEIITGLLAFGDIIPGGKRPWDITVHNDAFYAEILSRGSMGLGESYMLGQWDCLELDQFFYKLMHADLNHKLKLNATVVLHYLKNRLLNLQKKSRAFNVGQQHYDVGNKLYQPMLGKTMAYTCAYWENGAANLDQAQEAKYDLVCKKVGLRPGMKILDLGCGFGGFMKFAAEKYQVSAVGLTVSKEQVKLGKELCAGLPIEIQLKDYREVEGKFDRIISIGLMEHIGPKNYRTLFEIAHKHLANDGLCLFHTIGSNSSSAAATSDPWISKYIFPNGALPSAKQITQAAENLFILEDWHNFGADYDKTLMAWYHNFQAAWPELKKDYGDVFYRMWVYYLLSCAGSFRNRSIQLWQIVFSKNGVPGGYRSVR